MDMSMSMTPSVTSSVDASMTMTMSSSTSTSTASMSMDGMMGECKINMLWNWYTIDACFLSSSWRITSAGMFAGSCIGVICLVITLEFLRRVQREYDAFTRRQDAHLFSVVGSVARDGAEIGSSSSSGNSGLKHAASSGQQPVPAAFTIPTRGNRRTTLLIRQLIRSLIHMLQFAVAYFVMLLAMYYNGYFIICIFIGAFLGSFIFSWDQLLAEPVAQGQCHEDATVCCGAASGFGLAITRKFLEEGAKVVAADVNTEALAANDWKATVDLAEAKFGGLDIVVNNAGTSYRNKPTLEVTEEEFAKVFAVNVKSVFLSVPAAVPALRRRGGGSIVNVASIGAIRPRPGLVWYNASKGAVANATKGLAAEYGKDGIRVNSILPLLSGTGLFETFVGVPPSEENMKKFLFNVPLGRLTDGTDVANAAAYLASDEGMFITDLEHDDEQGRRCQRMETYIQPNYIIQGEPAAVGAEKEEQVAREAESEGV
ncbi:hypothetical protein DV738_g1623, partial [Chaetothyriales sp. CBS 135597]